MRSGERKLTDQQVLEKAIQQAMDGGWRPFSDREFKNVRVEHWQEGGMVEVALIDSDIIGAHLQWVRELEGIIFNHDFAKALWGEGWAFFTEGQSGDTLPSGNYINWKGHMANMAVSVKPLNYLRKNI